MSGLSHLDELEAEAIYIIREVAAECEKPVMLYSIGKDSSVMLHLALKAFYPEKPPFPFLHVNTTWKFKEMIEFRDKTAKDLGIEMLEYINEDGVKQGINPFDNGSAYTDIMKTQALKQALNKYGFTAAFGGGRRDEEKSRAKERIFSFRNENHAWDPKNQRPEMWKLYNTEINKGESIRVFPISNWTEKDIWQYIKRENIPIVPLYFAKERPVVYRDGNIIMVDDDRMRLKPGEKPEMKKVRAVMNKWQNDLEGKAWNSLYWDNHDQPRAVSRFGDDSPMYREVSAKMIATCLHMLKGSPYIYQGEEIGMTNAYFKSIDDYKDIEAINAYKEYTESGLMTEEEMLNCLKMVSRDNARTPMQWDDSANAGFTTGTPWISVNKNYTQINAKAALEDKDSVFYYYQKLIRLRHENEIIVEGVFHGLLEDNDDIYAYERTLGDEKLVVACNFTNKEVPCDLFEGKEGEELITNYKNHVAGALQPYETRVILYK